MIMRTLLFAAIPAAFMLFAGLHGPVEAAEVSPALFEAAQELAPGEKLPVIVRFSAPSDTEAPSRADRRRREKIISKLKSRMQDSVGSISELLARRKAAHRALWIINGISVKADAAMLEALSKHPRVAAVTLDAELPGPGVSYGGQGTPEWNVSMVEAPELWSMDIDGSGAVVASMDTGVDFNHPDLNGSWRGGTNSWYDPYGEHPYPHDANGHGTMIMGIMTGAGSGGTSIGVAPGAKWISAKIFKDNGYASLSAIHLGFQWLLDPDGNPATDDAPAVVNNSWGLGNLDGCSTEFSQDIQVLSDAGIMTVFAAGNYGPNQYTSTSPANGPVPLSVGALDNLGNLAGFSSRGPSACGGSIYPLISAPGADIRTSDLTYGGAIPLSYSIVSGTSFASAHVSGALALLSSAFPEAGAGKLAGALLSTAHDLGQTGADNGYGSGLIKLNAAYDLLAGHTPPGSEPITDLDGDGASAEADCDDNDPAVYPGAGEVKFDGIDQDCNGYDLTINITRATYSDTYRSLRIEAKSSLGADAALNADGYGPMNWSSNLNKWVLTVRTPSMPAEVTVSGVEGVDTLSLSPPEPQPVPEPEPLPVPVPEPDPEPMADHDNDGFPSVDDCNDNDPAINPGAIEIRFDGIDQDCNGYDLTINITRSSYSAAYKSLRIEVKSSLGEGAKLQAEGFGPMSWSVNLKKWVLTVRTPFMPDAVIVTGVEGSTSAPVM
ncbi:minor extracellular serine protease Vpr [uncultured bacterium]|nr:minor extracellular serine protease Vpr [uncultured bacterium]